LIPKENTRCVGRPAHEDAGCDPTVLALIAVPPSEKRLASLEGCRSPQCPGCHGVQPRPTERVRSVPCGRVSRRHSLGVIHLGGRAGCGRHTASTACRSCAAAGACLSPLGELRASGGRNTASGRARARHSVVPAWSRGASATFSAEIGRRVGCGGLRLGLRRSVDSPQTCEAWSPRMPRR
jgi:hypothetical protein